MTSPLVLSLFPGIGLLDMAFEAEGFCIVRGPDLLWGGDVRRFHPPAGKFDGVIGGPPCQKHSSLKHLALIGNGVEAGVHGDQIPEFVRCIEEAAPLWFLMENVRQAPIPTVAGYQTDSVLLHHTDVGGDTMRVRRFTLGARAQARLAVETLALFRPDPEYTVLAGHGDAQGKPRRRVISRGWKEGARLQGVPEERIEVLERDSAFTQHGLRRVIGNGVPLPMGRAIARAVKAAMYPELAERAS